MHTHTFQHMTPCLHKCYIKAQMSSRGKQLPEHSLLLTPCTFNKYWAQHGQERWKLGNLQGLLREQSCQSVCVFFQSRISQALRRHQRKQSWCSIACSNNFLNAQTSTQYQLGANVCQVWHRCSTSFVACCEITMLEHGYSTGIPELIDSSSSTIMWMMWSCIPLWNTVKDCLNQVVVFQKPSDHEQNMTNIRGGKWMDGWHLISNSNLPLSVVQT